MRRRGLLSLIQALIHTGNTLIVLTLYHISIYDTDMPHVSKRTLDPRTEIQINKTFKLVLGKLNAKEIDSFLFSILSDTERMMLAKRLAIVLLLKQGIDDSSISEALCVTRVTVNRMHLFSEIRPEGFELASRKISEDQAMQEVKNTLVKLASYSIKSAGGRVDTF